MSVIKTFLRATIMLLFFSAATFAHSGEPAEIDILRKSYPDIKFDCVYDKSVFDYRITISVGKRSEVLYWQGGKYLPESEMINSKNFTSIFYEYSDKILDPSTFTKEYIKELEDYSSPDNRKNGPGSPTFIFDVIYESDSRKNVEKHITKTIFLGKASYVHDRIVKPLKNVEKKIKDLAKVDKTVDNFIKNLDSAGSYNWRTIADSGRRSFHSMGVAVDVLPIGWGKKNVYWAWRRDIDSNWMMLPLEKRWTPPESVIRIFESEGFIYGGKWDLWDNMHFEYRPELILYTKRLNEQRAAAKKLEEQREAERKLEEQREAERKLEEQREAERKLEEQREAERKLEEQREAERKLEEQREAERKLEEQREAERKLEEQRAAEENLDVEKSAENENPVEIPEEKNSEAENGGELSWEEIFEKIEDEELPEVELFYMEDIGAENSPDLPPETGPEEENYDEIPDVEVFDLEKDSVGDFDAHS